MPTNRTRISRFLPRRQIISEEVVDLFVELEHLNQDSDEFRIGSKKLAAMLDLNEEHFLSGCTVNDKGDEPHHPAGYIAREDWMRCREMRNRLLAAVKDRPPLALDDSQMQTIFTAAAPIAVERRAAFLETVARNLEGHKAPGPGTVNTAIRRPRALPQNSR
jgi:hypothetical protein